MYTFCKAISIYTNNENSFIIVFILLSLMAFCFYTMFMICSCTNTSMCHTFDSETDVSVDGSSRFKGKDLKARVYLVATLFYLLSLLILEVYALGFIYYMSNYYPNYEVGVTCIFFTLIILLGVLPAILLNRYIKVLVKTQRIKFNTDTHKYEIVESK